MNIKIYDFSHSTDKSSVGEMSRFDHIRKELISGEVIGIDGLFSMRYIDDFRNALSFWSKTRKPRPHGEALQDIPVNENFYRIDDEPEKSSAPHVYKTYVLGRISLLEGDLSRLGQFVFSKMLHIQNSLAGTTAQLERAYRETLYLRPQIIHYPRGGGYLAEHIHQFEPQKFGLILNLSNCGTDYQEGGTFFRGGDEELIQGGEIGKKGRVIVFKYDLPHGVNVIDRNSQLSWDAEDGKWSAVLPLY